MPLKKNKDEAEHIEIVAIVDRSGSMMSCREEAEKGFNHFIAEQQEQPGEASFTMAEFDDRYDLLSDNEDLSTIGNYALVPRGLTALYDAVGKTLSTVNTRQKAKRYRGKTLVVIVTDGAENASKEWRYEAVQMLIKKLKKKGWEFLFLASDINAVQYGILLGVPTWDTSKSDYVNTYACASQSASAYRSGTAWSPTAADSIIVHDMVKED